jgi:dienelactone hydrolase
VKDALAWVLGVMTLVWLLEAPALGQTAEAIRPGVVVRQVVVKAAPDQSYALYLPSSYDPGRLWPVIYAFDPSARGYQPVECFREAAEKYGYVLVGSNVSRNGPVPPSVSAGMAMIRDSAARFSLDGKRIYATGFSGGARIACTMAQLLEGEIAGVIGCAAGFPSGAGPRKAAPFAFLGTIGNEDYNWIEMNRLDRTLESLALPHRLLRFDGGHVWPPRDVAMAAVEWLELEAMKAGTRPKDEGFIAQRLEAERAKAEAEEAAGSLRDAWGRYVDIAAAFKGLADVTAVEAKATALRGHNAVKDQVKAERNSEAAEFQQMSRIEQLMLELSNPEKPFAGWGELQAQIVSFRDNEKRATTPAARLRARRQLGHVNITAFYAGQPLYDSKQYDAALPYLQLQAAVYPESAGTQYRLAVAQAATKKETKALDALEKAAGSGFSDAARIDEEPAFDKLRDDARFKGVLERIKANAKAS